MKIKLINKYKPEPVDVAFYIGRGSGLGNPFSHIPSKFPDVIKVKSREEACEKYQAMFDKHIANGTNPPKKAIALLNQMKGALKEGKYIGLVCFCAPHKCHGETIKKWLEEQI